MSLTRVHPLVSVIIPAYNQGPLLARAIESVLAQTYMEREIIVVNDGSTDDVARRTVEPHGDKVTYIERPNGGVAAARNTGIQAARGELIALLDQDDVWLPHKLETQVRAVNANRGLAVVHSSFYLINEYGERTGIRRLPEGRYRPLPRLLLENHISPCTAVFVRALVSEQQPFASAVNGSDDWDLWLRLALDGHDFYCVSEPLAEYRVHASMTSTDDLMMALSGLEVLDRAYANRDLPAAVCRTRGRAYALRHGWAASVMLARGALAEASWHLVRAAKADAAYATSPAYARLLVRTSTGTDVHAGRFLSSALRAAGLSDEVVRRGLRSMQLAIALSDGRGKVAATLALMVLRHPAIAADRDLWAALLKKLRRPNTVRL